MVCGEAAPLPSGSVKVELRDDLDRRLAELRSPSGSFAMRSRVYSFVAIFSVCSPMAASTAKWPGTRSVSSSSTQDGLASCSLSCASLTFARVVSSARSKFVKAEHGTPCPLREDSWNQRHESPERWALQT